MPFDRSLNLDGTKRRKLYPPIEPYKTGMLDTGDGHSPTCHLAHCWPSNHKNQ